MKKKPDKQHDARGASFKRIAKALRVRAKNEKPLRPDVANFLHQVAAEMDFEATTLRAMR